MTDLSTNVAIIGAGPAGLISAAYLLDKGVDVMLIEKAVFPRFIIGESLLPSSMEHFEKVGLLNVLDDQNYLVKNGARFYKDGKMFNLDFSEQFTKGKTWTWQVPRAHFDHVMAKEVESRGAVIHYGAKVDDVDFSSDDPILKFSKEGTSHQLKCHFIIDSSGFGSVIPRLLNEKVEKRADGNSAFYTHCNDYNKAVSDKPNQISFEVMEQDLWFWVIPITEQVTSIGFVGDQSYFKGNDSGAFKEMLGQLAFFEERYQNPDLLFDPIYTKTFTQKTGKLFSDKYVLTGNCIEFLDPIFSSGVAFATESGFKAAELVHRWLKGEKVDWQKEYVTHINAGVDVFRSYVNAWYDGDLQKLFFSDNIVDDYKRKICSVLAGYVWDTTNPMVKKHKTIVKTLAHFV